MNEMIKVVGISGPDGGGKGYLSQRAIDGLGLQTVGMLTTRPSRPYGEEKICISDEEFKALKAQGELVGDHINKGFSYAYRISDFQNIKNGAILELNPVFQTELASQLPQHGIILAGWIGLYGDPDYLKANIVSRDPSLPENQIIAKLEMAEDIMNELQRLHKQGVVTDMFKVSWENRSTMGQEFVAVVAGLLKKK